MKRTLLAIGLGYAALFVFVGAWCSGLIMLDGCSTVQTHAQDLPNLSCVDSNRNVWRCGQPTAAGFAKLARMGVTNSVKLNEKSEGADAIPLNNLRYVPISLSQQIGLSPLPKSVLEDAVCCMITPGTVVHCLHGEDRTGLVVARYRVQVQGWSKEAAEKEMLAHGFHKELLGLWHAWGVTSIEGVSCTFLHPFTL